MKLGGKKIASLYVGRKLFKHEKKITLQIKADFESLKLH